MASSMGVWRMILGVRRIVETAPLINIPGPAGTHTVAMAYILVVLKIEARAREVVRVWRERREWTLIIRGKWMTGRSVDETAIDSRLTGVFVPTDQTKIYW